MEDENSFVTVLSPGEHCLEKRDGFSLSLFAFSQRVENLSIRGAKYELEKGNLENSFPLGASNEFRDDVHISFERGQLLVVCSRLEG
jgi:thiamine pyrophosphokinase